MKTGATTAPATRCWLRAFLGRDHHHHLPAFQLGEGFDLADLGHVGLDPFQKLQSKLLVGHLAAPEAQGDFHLVAFLQELHHRAHLHVIVMRVGAGPELDFLDLDDLLLLAGFRLALLRLVFELAEVHDLADRRDGRRRDFHQVQSGFLGHLHRAGRGHDPDILAIRPDQADFRSADAVVDAGTGFALRRGIVRSAGYGSRPLMVQCAAAI